MCCLNARSFPAFLLISCKVPVFSLFHSVNILPRLNFGILHSVILLPRFHVPCFLYIPRFAFAPWGKNFWHKPTSTGEVWFVTSAPSSAQTLEERDIPKIFPWREITRFLWAAPYR